MTQTLGNIENYSKKETGISRIPPRSYWYRVPIYRGFSHTEVGFSYLDPGGGRPYIPSRRCLIDRVTPGRGESHDSSSVGLSLTESWLEGWYTVRREKCVRTTVVVTVDVRRVEVGFVEVVVGSIPSRLGTPITLFPVSLSPWSGPLQSLWHYPFLICGTSSRRTLLIFVKTF